MDKDNMPDDISMNIFTLESILAEYKGSAYINGDKRTPTELLNEEAERIVMEESGRTTPINRPQSDVQLSEPEIEDQSAELLFDKPSPETETENQSAELLFDKPSPETETEDQNAEILFDKPSPEIKAEEKDLEQLFSIPHPELEIEDQQPELIFDKMQPEVSLGEQHPEFLFEKPNPDDIQEEPQIWHNPFATEQEKAAANGYAMQNTEINDVRIADIDSEPDEHDSIIQDVARAVERELGYVDQQSITEDSTIDFFGHFEAVRKGTDFEQGQIVMDEEFYEEPDLQESAKRFAEECNSISLRSVPTALITIMMVILTFAYESGLIIPFGIGRVQPAAVGTLIIGLLVIMILCSDIILRGALDLARGAPNAETLVLFSCGFSIISGVFTILRGSPTVMTYCAVSALSLTFAAIGEKYSLRAITDTLKVSVGSSEPYGLLADYNSDIKKSVLKKASNRYDGFYNNLMRPDIAETLYRYATPILIALALVLSVVSAIARGHGEYFLHILSALLAAAAPFSAMLAFSLPFIAVSKSIRKSGAAIAGWGGTEEICFSDGACVTDEDLFPHGTLAFNGIKLYEGISPEKAISYTASLIIESGSGLTRIYSEVLKTLGMNVVKVQDFACYEGGIGALLHGQRVMTGSAAYMNLLGIRVPDDMNMKNAVYTAINDKLAAMFVVDYEPINSVQSALISILKWRIKLFFAVRDFNVTPLMLEQKFKVSLEDVEYIQARDSYSMSDLNTGKEGRVAAVLTREGLGPLAEAVTGGRLLRSAALVSTVISIASALFGMLIMFYISWTGAFLSAGSGNLIVFMLSMLAAVLIVCGYTRCKK